jgi:hypothetical protein
MTRSLPPAVLAFAVCLVLAPGAGAAPKPVSAQTSGIVLPGDARAAGVRQTGRTWIVAGRPGAATARLVGRFGGRPVIASAGVYVVPIRNARAVARALGDGLTLAEPDALASKRAFPSDPLTPGQWWVPAVVDPSLDPPAVTSASPVLGVIEEELDPSHPDTQGMVQVPPPGKPLRPPPDAHGTAVAAVAGAPANGTGTVGIWPGMRILLPVYNGVACSTITDSVNRAVLAGVSVINMSYGFVGGQCRAHLIATEKAFARGIVLVAAGGNEFEQGNPGSRPGIDPHVISVAAINRDDSSSFFSSEHPGIDVSAPGTELLTAVPPQFDDDGTADGFTQIAGTSFSSPIVAAAVTWLRAVRPTLKADQVQRMVQLAAIDLSDDAVGAGWDQRYGYGKVNLARLLAAATPRRDPLEPNDDAEWVDGRRLRARPTFTGRTRVLRARLQQVDDALDVYRAVIPRRSTVRFRLFVLAGDADLDVYRAGTRTITRDAGLLGRSRRSGRRTDVVTITNRSRRPRPVLVNPYVLFGTPHDAAYRLQIKRVKFRG